MKKFLIALAIASGIFAFSSSASAWWYGGNGVRVYVGPGPYYHGYRYYGGPYYYRPYYRGCWVPGHYNYYGYWVPGHRRC